MSYIHPKTKTEIGGYNSHAEHCFYEETTKRQLFLLVQSFSDLLKDDDQDWVNKAKEELVILKLNGFK